MSSKKMTALGLLLALSLVLAYLESLFPTFIAIPGVKLGVANIVTVVALYRYGAKYAYVIMLLRVMLAGFLFSGMAGILYGLIGGSASVIVMWIAKKSAIFSTIGVSILGGICHNLFQIIVAYFMMSNVVIFYYFPVLLCTGTVAGLAVGYLSFCLYKRIEKTL